MADRGNDYRRDEDEEAEEEVDEADYKTQKDAVIFAIDVSSSMLRPPPASDDKKADKDSALSAALKCAYQIMQQRIISSPKDMMGILFFGTKKSKFREETDGHGGSGYPQCYLFMDLDIPAAEDVKALKSLVEDGEDPDEVLCPSEESATMANVLFCANQVFATNAPNFGSRRLFIITDNDNPHGGDKSARSSAAVRAKDLYDLGVLIELFAVSREDHKFELSNFYDDIIYRDPATEEGNSDAVNLSKSGDGLTLLSSLVSNINSKQTPKRAYFSNLPFQIAPGLLISVNGYITLHRQKPARTCYVWLGGEKPQLAKSETANMMGGSTKIVEKGEIKKAYKFGGDYVYFTPEEQNSIKDWNMGPAFKKNGLRIIGFKDRSLLPLWASVKRSVFIFPSEVDYVGSTRVFSALWQKLLESKKMAIAWFVARSNATPLLVAILPSRSQAEDESATTYIPGGLWLYPLPFADDIREIDKRITAKASDGLIDQMRPIVQNLRLPKGIYNPTKYPNPSLQWHYKILQVLALDEEVPERGEDATEPKCKTITKRVGGYLVDLNESIEQDAETLQTARAVKREAEDSGDERPAKKSKLPASSASSKKAAGGSMSTAELRRAMDKGTLSKMTVVELKDVLAARSLGTSGKKADLVERLEQWLEENK